LNLNPLIIQVAPFKLEVNKGLKCKSCLLNRKLSKSSNPSCVFSINNIWWKKRRRKGNTKAAATQSKKSVDVIVYIICIRACDLAMDEMIRTALAERRSCYQEREDRNYTFHFSSSRFSLRWLAHLFSFAAIVYSLSSSS
jgi:hypothetical protein